MSIYGIGGSPISAYDKYSTTSTKKNKVENNDSENKSEKSGSEELGVVYEPSAEVKDDSVKKTDTDYSSIISQLKKAADAHTKQLQDLVSKLFTGQAAKFNTSLKDAFEAIRDGKVKVDPETVEQAKKDVAEDGEWGVEKTSERLVEMAKALSGGDATKADKMITAVKKGFDQATKAWGGDLPEISKKTLDTTVKKLEDWRDGLTSNTAE